MAVKNPPEGVVEKASLEAETSFPGKVFTFWPDFGVLAVYRERRLDAGASGSWREMLERIG